MAPPDPNPGSSSSSNSPNGHKLDVRTTTSSSSPKSSAQSVTLSNSSERPATLLDGLLSIKLSDFTSVHKKPCARESFLTGIGSGFVIGGLRLITGGTPWRSMTFAIFSFTLFSGGAHAICQRKRAIEKAYIARAADIMAKKNEERAFQAAQAQAAKEAAREERRQEHEKQKTGWLRWSNWKNEGG